MALNTLNLDSQFTESCLGLQEKSGNLPPASATSASTLVSPSNAFDKLDLGEDSVSDTVRLTNRYAAAYTDFYGVPSGASCIYKSGPARSQPAGGPHPQRQVREARPVYNHRIVVTWIEIGTKIYKFLNSCSMNWNSIDPVAFANTGEKTQFCPLLVWTGVVPKTLSYDKAVDAANAIKGILGQAGFPEIELAFRESEVTRSGSDPKLLSFNPLEDPIPEF